MNILETFYFIFDSDAKKLDKGLTDSTKQTDKLEKELQHADKTAGGLGGTFMDLAGKAAFALGAAFSVSAIKATVSEVNEYVDALGDSADALGVNVSMLQAWDNAARLSDGETGALIASLGTLNTGFNSIATKGTGLMLPFLKDLGLSLDDVKEAAKDPLTGLLKMSDAFSKLSASEAAGLGQKIGLDQGTINLLRQGKAGVEDMLKAQEAAGLVTAEQKALFDAYNKELINADLAWQNIKRNLVTLVIPALTWLLEKGQRLTEWAKDNKTFVISFFTALAAVLVGVYLPAVLSAAAATWALAAPYIAVGLAALAFAAILGLVMDDIWAFQTGNKSVIGELAGKWPSVGKVIKGVGLAIVWATVALNAFGQLVSDLFNGSAKEAIENFDKTFKRLVADISDSFPIVQKLYDLLTIIPSKLLRAQVNSALDMSEIISGARQKLSVTQSPISSQNSTSISNGGKTSSKNTTVRIDKVSVNTQATDAEGTARALSFGLSKEMRNAIDGVDDGVAA